jgi:hypothetical protein
MNQETTNDVLNYDAQEQTKLPSGLNVLTILTFVGCAYELYNSINGFLSGKKALAEMEKAQEKLAEAPAWARKFAGPEMMEVMQKGIENRVPILIIGLVAIALCVYGAMEMRKLKKQGYTLWLIGEVLPYVSAAIFVPAFFGTFLVFFIIIPAIFIILYTVQRKRLKY